MFCARVRKTFLFHQKSQRDLNAARSNGNGVVKKKFSCPQFRESSFRIFKQICFRKHAKITKNFAKVLLHIFANIKKIFLAKSQILTGDNISNITSQGTTKKTIKN